MGGAKIIYARSALIISTWRTKRTDILCAHHRLFLPSPQIAEMIKFEKGLNIFPHLFSFFLSYFSLFSPFFFSPFNIFCLLGGGGMCRLCTPLKTPLPVIIAVKQFVHNFQISYLNFQ